MKKLLRTSIYLWIFVGLTLANPLFSEATDIEKLSKRLEKSLNNKNEKEIQALTSKEIAKGITLKHEKFLMKFPNAKWVIKPSKLLKDKRQSIEIIVTGNRKTSTHNYHLISNQILAITTKEDKIIGSEVLSDYSILRSGSKKLDVTIGIPNSVLTGSNYDIDIIIEKPLKEPIIAAGIVSMNPNESNNNIELIINPDNSMYIGTAISD